uniref:Uncharacterized protein n=1 Tax=Setaria italica TaxID=4555 RepID=K4AHT2_SETIT
MVSFHSSHPINTVKITHTPLPCEAITDMNKIVIFNRKQWTCQTNEKRRAEGEQRKEPLSDG